MNKKILIILTIILLVTISGCITGFSVFKPDCPHACCVDSREFKIKSCNDPTYNCKQNQCVKCGNYNKEIGENCLNCPSDAACSENEACSSTGQCITLGTNINCEHIGSKCQFYEECINFRCAKKQCPHECCDGSTYKYKKCDSSFSFCSEAEHRCVNKAANTMGKVAEEAKDTLDKAIDSVADNMDKILLW